MAEPRSRSSIARAAAKSLRDLEPHDLSFHSLVGFDGFIDAIMRVVDRRQSMASEDFHAITTISGFAARCLAAAGKSANIELHLQEERFGGNGPLMAGALAKLGTPTTYIGAVGQESDWRMLHPIYERFATACHEVIAVAAPGYTNALEFDDGKLMLGIPAAVQAVTWDRLIEAVGLDGLIERFERAHLIGLVNWTLSGGVPGIWEGMIEHVLPRLTSDHPRQVFVDLSDPAKRTDADIMSAMNALAQMNMLVPVTLGLNLSESERIDRVIGIGSPAADSIGAGSNEPIATRLKRTAESLRSRIDIDCVVIHPREGAAAATGDGHIAWFDGPFTRHPRLSTGAGDHFNGGFAFAQSLGLGLDECLATACAVSGTYVRDAESPTLDRVIEFLDDLPEPEPESEQA